MGHSCRLVGCVKSSEHTTTRNQAAQRCIGPGRWCVPKTARTLRDSHRVQGNAHSLVGCVKSSKHTTMRNQAAQRCIGPGRWCVPKTARTLRDSHRVQGNAHSLVGCVKSSEHTTTRNPAAQRCIRPRRWCVPRTARTLQDWTVQRHFPSLALKSFSMSAQLCSSAALLYFRPSIPWLSASGTVKLCRAPG
jgi:hypothetical protein